MIPLTDSDWTYSDDHDIAAAPIDYVKGNKYLFISVERFLTQMLAATHDVGIGDEVFMVGRFINNEGRQQNNPAVRFGNVCMMPTDVSDIDDPTRQEESFCIETHTIPGYSGSPVFVRPVPSHKLYAHESFGSPTNTAMFANPVSISSEAGTTRIFGGPWLLGIEWGYIHYYDPQDEQKKVKFNTGMSGVVPAWHILELLNSEKLKEQRRQEQERLIRDQEGITLT